MDERLRELERASQLDPSMRGKYISLLVSLQRLDPFHVAYAAYLGDTAALSASSPLATTIFRETVGVDLHSKISAVVNQLPFSLCALLTIETITGVGNGFEQEVAQLKPLLLRLIEEPRYNEELVNSIYELATDIRAAEYEYFLHGYWRQRDVQQLIPETVDDLIESCRYFYWGTYSDDFLTEDRLRERLDYARQQTIHVLDESRRLSESFASDIGHYHDRDGYEGVSCGLKIADESHRDDLVNLLLTPEIHLRRNPDTPPIIVIGYSDHYSWQLDKILDDMETLGWDNLRSKLLNREFEVYDMSTLPEKGDARDHIRPDTPLIVALHLYGMNYHDRYSYSSIPGYMYNQGNYKIYLLAQEWNIPLMVIGDQPEDKPLWGEETFSHQYFTDKAN